MERERKGVYTSEFWLSTAATLVGILMASGVIAEDTQWGKLLGMIAVLLTSLGYTVTRGMTKSASAKAVAVASVANPTQPQ